MEDRATENRPKGRQLVAPVRREAVLTQRFVLGPDLDPFLGVGGETQAARATEGVTGE